MYYYNISPHGFFFTNYYFFFQNDLCQFCFVVFSLKHSELLQCFPTWFLFCYSVSPHVFFFQNYVCQIYFFNIELVENLTLAFPICFFYFFYFSFFPKLSFFTYLFLFFSELFFLFFFLLLSQLKFQFFCLFL